MDFEKKCRFQGGFLTTWQTWQVAPYSQVDLRDLTDIIETLHQNQTQLLTRMQSLS